MMCIVCISTIYTEYKKMCDIHFRPASLPAIAGDLLPLPIGCKGRENDIMQSHSVLIVLHDALETAQIFCSYHRDEGNS